MKWKDTSSYSRSETARETKSVEAVAGGMKIAVTRHIHHPGKWLMTCAPFSEILPLASLELDAAKIEAVNIVRAHIQKVAEALN